MFNTKAPLCIYSVIQLHCCLDLSELMGTSINCRERLEYEAIGARDTGVYTECMRISSTDQRSNHGAQQINRGALMTIHRGVHK